MNQEITSKLQNQNEGRQFLLFALVLFVLLLLAYSNSFQVPFIYDDLGSIPNNPSIKSVWNSIVPVFNGGEAITGRPILNFTLALNYQMGGFDERWYHATNLLIHYATGLILFLFLYSSISIRGYLKDAKERVYLSGGVVLLWAVHPLQTESVTYIVERSELLVGGFYIGTLYAFQKSLSGKNSHRWLLVSVISCYAAVFSKEVGATIPLVVFLYHRLWIKESVKSLFRKRRFYYYGLLSSWIPLAWLVLEGKGRGSAVGFGVISYGDHIKTQLYAHLTYLKLTFFPLPLIFDYGIVTGLKEKEVAIALFVLIAFFALITWCWVKKRESFFWWVCSILLMIPSALVPLSTEMIVEHRVYLSLVFFLMGLILFAYPWIRKGYCSLIAALIVLSAGMTFNRNLDYQSVDSLWESVIRERPQNYRGYNNLAAFFHEKRDLNKAKSYLEKSIEINPTFFKSYNHLGNIYMELGSFIEAEKCFRQSIDCHPNIPDTWFYLGCALEFQNRLKEAEQAYLGCLQIDPFYYNATFGVGSFYLKTNNLLKAKSYYQRCTDIDPKNPLGYLALARVFESQGQSAEAEDVYLRGLKHLPTHQEFEKCLEALQSRIDPL